MNLTKFLIPSLAAFSIFAACTTPKTELTLSGLNPSRFDTVANGKKVALYTLKNSNGMEACITNYGARIVSIMVDDRDGVKRDVVLGFDNITDYMANNIPYGAMVGRNANRIRDGRFTLEGKEYILDKNDGNHSLHGGPKGWQGQIFEVKNVTDSSLVLTYFSPDGESGFPGNVDATVTYTVDYLNTLKIDYDASSDATTVINFTNHSYFALSGDPTQTILSNDIFIDSDYFTPKSPDQIPRGDIAPVDGTPMDFRTMANIGERISQNMDVEEIQISGGFGVNMILNNKSESDVDIVLYSPESGIEMSVYTSQPSFQFFTCNGYDKSYTGKKGIAYEKHKSICLETQHYPNAVNNPEWPSPIIKAGERYKQHCYYRFGVGR